MNWDDYLALYLGVVGAEKLQQRRLRKQQDAVETERLKSEGNIAETLELKTTTTLTAWMVKSLNNLNGQGIVIKNDDMLKITLERLNYPSLRVSKMDTTNKNASVNKRCAIDWMIQILTMLNGNGIAFVNERMVRIAMNDWDRSSFSFIGTFDDGK